MQQEIVENKKFYHFQNYDNGLWKEGNEFIVGNDFKSFASFCFEYKPLYRIEDKNLIDLIDDAYAGKLDQGMLYTIKNMTKSYILNTNMNHREYLLESIREMYYKDIISRGKCLFLTDEESIDFWKDKFKEADNSLYEVEVSGKIFKSYECLLPSATASIDNQIQQAHCYWQAKLEDYSDFHEHDYSDSEYLFQGKVKVLSRVK